MEYTLKVVKRDGDGAPTFLSIDAISEEHAREEASDRGYVVEWVNEAPVPVDPDDAGEPLDRSEKLLGEIAIAVHLLVRHAKRDSHSAWWWELRIIVGVFLGMLIFFFVLAFFGWGFVVYIQTTAYWDELLGPTP